MRKLLSLLWQPLLFVLLALLVLSVLIWWMGPLVRIGALAPLASELARALLIGALVLLVLGRYLWRRWRARSASRQLAEELVKPEPVAATALPDAAAEEQKLLAGRFAEAIQTLRKMRLQQAGGKPGWRDWLSISAASAPSFSSLRQWNNWFGFTPCCRATSDTDIPGSYVWRTIDSFSEAVHRLRRWTANTSTSLLFGLVIDTALCLPLRLRQNMCPEIQGATSIWPNPSGSVCGVRACAKGKPLALVSTSVRVRVNQYRKERKDQSINE